MTKLFDALRYNFSLQFVSRLLSFGINMYLLRVVDSSVIGLVNVRLMLLYDTVLFLTREPMRKASILNENLQRFVNLIWLSPLISMALCGVIVPLWMYGSSTPLALPVVLSFAGSAVIEALAEPFCVISLRFSLDKHFAVSQGLLIALKRVFIFALILDTPIDHLTLFSVAQIVAAVAFTLFNYAAFYRYAVSGKAELASFRSYRDFFPRLEEGFDAGSIKAVSTLLAHSVLKQLLTDGSAFVMTFTRLLTLPQQAVYDSIERLGSLVSRLLLAPLEESSFAYFSNAISSAKNSVFKQNTDSHDVLVRTFTALMRDLIVCGLVVSAFGVPYSGVAVSIYGGQVLVANGGASLLATYAVYILIIAINGVTEAFAFATMNVEQIFSHGGFLLVSSLVHLSLSYALCLQFGAIGFILANMANMSVRIVYSWRHINKYLGMKCPSVFALLPSFGTIVFMGFALMGGLFSLVLFGSTPGLSHTLSHLAVGGVLFVMLALHIWQAERPFVTLMKKTQ
ncbi:rfth-1 [Pristionchus pacificus]|uniref:Protein RFT1 homolog n=1 Tax=Pristionchus pacificus TaxID=54126 RepID=A0A2A6BWY9_PRIPA|nr:rfth-1 [Pristionchus pacificus]|eukprot:PDM70283.1 hypothetical protein PRIPAC_46529 [Pristionchus pacificus]